MVRRFGAHRSRATKGTPWAALVVAVILGLAGCSGAAPPSASPNTSPPNTSPATSTPSTSTPSSLPRGILANGAPAMGPGRASVTGTVQDPSGIVAGATVEVERLVGGSTARAMLTSGADGTWQLPGVLGGRYLVRAWLAPTLGQTSPTTFFLDDGEHRDVTLNLAMFSTPLVQSAIAPTLPIVAEPAQVVVQVETSQVQTDGSVASQPDVGLSVQLVSAGSWVISSPNPAVTDSLGQATWTATCSATGIHALEVDLAAPAGPSTYTPPATVPLGTVPPGTVPPGTTGTTTLAPAPTVAPQAVPINTPFCSLVPAPTIPTTTSIPAPTTSTTTTNSTGQTTPTVAGVGG